MIDIRCTQCGRLLVRNFEGRYAEFKCPKCGAINVVDFGDRGLTERKVFDRIRKIEQERL